MKRTVLFLIALTVVSVPLFAGSQTANLSVTASVAANCTISTSPVAFGAYDPVSANAVTALNGTGTVTVACTKGAAATVDLGQGSNYLAPNRQMNAGANLMIYQLYQDAARTQVWGSTVPTGTMKTYNSVSSAPTILTVYGQVPAGQNVGIGIYNDTVLATINY